MKPETQVWLASGEQELTAAQGLLNLRLTAQTIFHCHLAMEKLLKAVWVERHAGGVPPRTHDLVLVADGAGLQLPEWRTFLSNLSEQAVASRYASPDTYSIESAMRYFEQVNELWEVLRPELS